MRAARRWSLREAARGQTWIRTACSCWPKDIEIIGEAANQVSEEARTQFPDIPWADITGMRHRLVHAYFDINLEILWRTVQQDLPPLLVALEKALDEK